VGAEREVKMKRFLIPFFFFVLGVILVDSAFACTPEIPKMINYQGMLTNPDGTPVPDDNYKLTFKIFDDPLAGTEHWSEVHNSVPVEDGLFSVVLGSLTSIDINFCGFETWLEIKVEDDPPLSPRIKFTSVPYAFRAKRSDTCDVALASSGEGGWTDLGAIVKLTDSDDDVGIGTSSPGSKLHIRETTWGRVQIDGSTWGALVFGDHNDGANEKYFHIRSDGEKFYLGKVNDAFNTWSNQFVMERGGDICVGSSIPNHKLDVRGDVGIGSSTTNGSLVLYQDGAADPIIRAENYDSQGGRLGLYDDDNNSVGEFRVDGQYEGGFLNLYRSTGSIGFMVDGNYIGTNEPRVYIYGSSRSAFFYMDQSGNSSVQLPVSAISASEILDEPGVASDKEGIGGVALTTSYKTLLSRSIVCPASGYVLVLGTCQSQVSHTKDTDSEAIFGVSASSSSPPGNQDVGLRIDDAVESGVFQYPVTVHGLFEVSSGTKTFYFLAKKSTGSWTAYDLQLTLLYLPTAHGTVEGTRIGVEPNIPDEDAEVVEQLDRPDQLTEQAQTEAFVAQRIQKELDEMRAEIEALKHQLEEKQK
jgi:hypothetical protein